MKKTKSRGINEIKVKLLPEKAKRDYVLRLVSFIIVMVFVIVNFFIIFLPRRTLIEQLNSINSRITELQAKYDNIFINLNDLAQLFEKKGIYNITRNADIDKIEDKELDINEIMEELKSNMPVHSFIESVNYSDDRNEFIISMQFDTPLDLTTYQRIVAGIDFVESIKAGGYTITRTTDGEPRYKTNFLIKLIVDKCPKVGDSDE